jgi:hypothetical protein
LNSKTLGKDLISRMAEAGQSEPYPAWKQQSRHIAS